MDYFDYATGLRMCDNEKWQDIFGISRRLPESEITQPYMDMALAIQQVTEDIVLRLAQTARKLTGSQNLAMAGGVTLNCVANGKLIRKQIFDRIWIQPAAGDAGGALGAAYAACYIWQGKSRPQKNDDTDSMQGTYLGPAFTFIDVKRLCRTYNAPYKEYDDFSVLCHDVCNLLADGKVIGWFQGSMEYGPRALGNRSILGDPRNSEMQKKINLKIKYREGFRPFAPSVLAEDSEEYFNLQVPSPYMLLVDTVKENRRNQLPPGYEHMNLHERLYHIRSDIPAVTHVDYTARIQTVHKHTNERYWQLLQAYKELTGYGLLVNTSFNVRGEPIVCTPADAYRCFMRTEMDYLILENYLFDKHQQPEWRDSENWQLTYELD
jgi:carbamoyltransferase